MSDVTLEYSIFGVSNPFSIPADAIETFTDRYLYVAPGATLKIRDEQTVKYKKLLRHEDGVDIDTFQHMQFPNVPSEDPLRSFLEVQALGSYYQRPGITIPKHRSVYQLENGVHAYFCQFTIQSTLHTNLTLTSRNVPNLLKARERLQLIESNKSFALFLLDNVSFP